MKHIKILLFTAGAVVMTLTAILFGGCNKKPIVTFEKNNGEAPEQIEVVRGDWTDKTGNMLISNPIREGYFFNGWFLDEQCTKSAYGVHINENLTFYADWTDTYIIPDYMPVWLFNGYEDLFAVTTKAEPYNLTAGVSQLKLTLSVTPKGDFTGKLTTDRFELQITHKWLSDEMFMGEYVSDEVVAYVCLRDVWLDREHGYKLKDEVFIVDYNNELLEYPIYEYTYANNHTKTELNHIFEQPTLQYKH